MSMSTHVIGFKPPDEKWHKMKAIWDSCEEVEIDPPDAVCDYFNGKEPDEAGVEVTILTEKWVDDMREGVQIYIDKIPKDVKIIRFYNSW